MSAPLPYGLWEVRILQTKLMQSPDIAAQNLRNAARRDQCRRFIDRVHEGPPKANKNSAEPDGWRRVESDFPDYINDNTTHPNSLQMILHKDDICTERAGEGRH
jgi:hypothetical protein